MNRLYTIMEKWSQVLEVGATPPVDSFPLLRILPQRFLGNWRNRALECGSLMRSLYPEVIGRVEERRLRGVHKDTFIDHVLDQQEKNPLTRDELLFLGGGLMEAGSDTSAALILTIIQAMINYPQVQARYYHLSSLLGVPICGDLSLTSWDQSSCGNRCSPRPRQVSKLVRLF